MVSLANRLIVAATCLASFANIVPAQNVVRVSGNRGWQSSGLKLKEGQKIVLIAGGRVTHRSDHEEGINASPKGCFIHLGKKNPLPSYPEGSLIARVGASKPFFVGVRWEGEVDNSGELMFRINEADNKLADNSGWFEVTLPGPPKPKQPPQLVAVLSFSEPSDNGFLDAEEKGELSLGISNTGKGDAYGLQIKVEFQTTNPGLEIQIPPVIDKLSAGQRIAARIPIIASQNISSSKIALKIWISEANGFDVDPPLILTFSTRALAGC